MRNTLLAISLLAFGGFAVAATPIVTVNYHEPEKFTDIRPTNETRNRYEQRVLESVTTIFNDLASRLPEGYQWQIQVTDIDLAGEVDYFVGNAGQAVRVIRDVHSPAIRFEQSLRDSYGEELATGEVRLRDMGFLQRSGRLGHRPEFEHERIMLTDWFNKNVLPLVSQHLTQAPKVSQLP